jgi:hypothetical protein
MATVRVTMEPGWEIKVAGLAEPAMVRASDEIAAGQRRRIPVSRDGSHGRPPGYARSRISVTAGVDARGRYRDIGSDATTPDGTPYPLILDLGSAPHVIESHGDYPLRNPRTGQVFGRRVNHPGTRPTAWCRASIEDIRGKDYRV